MKKQQTTHTHTQTHTQKMKVNPDIVNRCVTLLSDPSRWDLSDEQKNDLCKKQGANPAEAAAAIFLVQHNVCFILFFFSFFIFYFFF